MSSTRVLERWSRVGSDSTTTFKTPPVGEAKCTDLDPSKDLTLGPTELDEDEEVLTVATEDFSASSFRSLLFSFSLSFLETETL
jgi:hypothetical protein